MTIIGNINRTGVIVIKLQSNSQNDDAADCIDLAISRVL